MCVIRIQPGKHKPHFENVYESQQQQQRQPANENITDVV